MIANKYFSSDEWKCARVRPILVTHCASTHPTAWPDGEDGQQARYPDKVLHAICEERLINGCVVHFLKNNNTL